MGEQTEIMELLRDEKRHPYRKGHSGRIVTLKRPTDDPCYWCKKPLVPGDKVVRINRRVLAQERINGSPKSRRFNAHLGCFNPHEDILIGPSSSPRKPKILMEMAGEAPQPQEPPIEGDLRLESLVAQQRAQAKSLLLMQLQSMSPTGFEHFVGRLLETMGFVDVVVTQRSYDGGIDGHCKHPVLDMDVVFQAKKWTNNVGGDPVAAFRGRVMAHYGRGFFITTSSFTPGAKEMAEDAGGAKIVLIDGDRLTELMIEKGLGVEEKPLTYWQVNEDFFSQFR